METFCAIEKRASIRSFQPKAIEKPLLLKLADAGRRAPTARAVEPWEFVIVQKKDVLQKLSEVAPNGSFIKGAAACIAIFCQETKYYLEDGCAATENILLAAADAGLGACWIAGDKKDYVSEVAKMFNAPDGNKLISLIALGWPNEEILQKKNRDLEEVIHWEIF